jgi:hypothetical protein
MFVEDITKDAGNSTINGAGASNSFNRARYFRNDGEQLTQARGAWQKA